MFMSSKFEEFIFGKSSFVAFSLEMIVSRDRSPSSIREILPHKTCCQDDGHVTNVEFS